MSTLTVHIQGVLDEALEKMIQQGYAKTKAEAMRLALMQFAEQHGLVPERRLHARAEEYMWDEIKQRLKLDVRGRGRVRGPDKAQRSP